LKPALLILPRSLPVSIFPPLFLPASRLTGYSDCILDPPAVELKAYAPYSQPRYLVITTPIITGSDDQAPTKIHGAFNTHEKANQKIEEEKERIKSINSAIDEKFHRGSNENPWFLEESYLSLWKEGKRPKRAKRWVEPIRSLTENKDNGFIIASARNLIQVGDEKSDITANNIPRFKSDQEIFIVAETAMGEDKSIPRSELKVYGLFNTLKDANEKDKEVVKEYQKWHNDMVKASGGNSLYKENKASWDGVDEKGGFFWVGARTRRELCRVDVKKIVVDWLQREKNEEDGKCLGRCLDGKCGEEHRGFSGEKGKVEGEHTEVNGGGDASSGTQGQLTFERRAGELLKLVAQQLGDSMGSEVEKLSSIHTLKSCKILCCNQLYGPLQRLDVLVNTTPAKV
jgi:hypothetical protein